MECCTVHKMMGGGERKEGGKEKGKGVKSILSSWSC